VSFTLPLPHDKRAEGAALQLAAKMGMSPALLVHAKPMGPDFTFFVVYGSGFGPLGSDHMRIVYLPPIEVLEEAFTRIERFVRKHSR
ncbi:MAG: OAM dimerization domain-containing protein, partial [Thermofilum sp.]